MIASAAVIGDFNADGKPDLAVDNVANNTVQIFLGVGDGTFQVGPSFALGQGVSLVALVDLNNDDKLDLVATDETMGVVSVFLGNGDGTFQAPTTYGTGASPVAVAVGDFNADGNLDLIVAVGSGISILLGNGDGTLQPEQTYAIQGINYTLGTVSVTPQSVIVGDFNGDGKLDVATANLGAPQETSQNDSISVLLGNGDGTFQSPVFYTTQQASSSIAVGDFNGDGKLDLAVSNISEPNYSETASSISVLIGNGDGTFQSPDTYNLPASTEPYSIHVSDFNGDGKADLAVSSLLGAETGGLQDLVFILPGNGDGTFQAQQGFDPASTNGGNSVFLTVGDFNGDGKPDLLPLERNYPPVSIGAAVLLNTGASTTVTAIGVSIPAGSSQLIQGSYSGDDVYSASISSAVPVSGITAAPVTWANPAAITYGTALSSLQLDASSPAKGKFTYAPGPGTVLGAGTQTLSVTFTPTDPLDYAPATQTVTLLVNPAPLNATAQNAVRVYGMANPVFAGTLTGAVNGDALVEIFATPANAGSPVGAYPIVPSVTGAAAANYAVTPSNGILTVSQVGTTTSFALSNQNLVLTAIVSSATTGVPTGSVSFFGGQALIGTATLTNGVASYTESSTPGANDSITAEYSGDANFTESSSPAMTILSVVPTATSLTVAQGGSVKDTLAISLVPGYQGSLDLSCSGLPQNSACSFQPTSISYSGTNTPSSVVVTIQTGISAVAGLQLPPSSLPGNLPLIPAAVLGMPGWLAVAAATIRRNSKTSGKRLMIPLLVLGGLTWITACGGGSPMTQTQTTPPGTSMVQITASGTSNLTQSVTLTLTVQ